jgi:Zn-dependent peptidase ImmA (M78 family)/DNA-binding XRE family transcriptional regulator
MINPERLRQIRELRGFSQVDLAAKVSVHDSLIAQVEAGYKQPSERLLELIALATGFPPSYFRQPSGVEFPFGSLLFRAHSAVTMYERLEAYRYAQILFETAEKLSRRLKPYPLRLPTGILNPTDAAQATRSDLGLSPDRPIKHLINAIEKGGISVFAIPTVLEKRDAFSAWVGVENPRPAIFLSGGKPYDRIRFSVAHELGHLVMHLSKQGSAREIECQADQFAAEFLMPAQGIRDELVPPVTLTTLANLKTRWGTSIQALILRARDLTVISPRQCRYLFQQLSARGWKTLEPVLGVTVEKPRAFRKMAETLYGLPINYKRLAEDVCLSPTFVRELMEVHADISEVAPKPSPNSNSSRVLHLKRI